MISRERALHISYIVSAATEAAVNASISAPVFAVTLTIVSMITFFLFKEIFTWQSSVIRGWQSGINSWVFFAAAIPAKIAVWKTGPFLVINSSSAIASIIFLVSLILA